MRVFLLMVVLAFPAYGDTLKDACGLMVRSDKHGHTILQSCLQRKIGEIHDRKTLEALGESIIFMHQATRRGGLEGASLCNTLDVMAEVAQCPIHSPVKKPRPH